MKIIIINEDDNNDIIVYRVSCLVEKFERGKTTVYISVEI